MNRSDSLGQTYNLTGFQAFCSVNNVLDAMGNATVSDAPALVTPASLLTCTPTLSSVAFSLAYTPTPLPAGAKLAVFVSPQRSAGRGFEGDFRFVQVTAAAAASPVNILAAYTAKFGVPVVGNRIFISLVVYLSGFRSGPLITSAVVA